jgi:hypothetical protein
MTETAQLSITLAERRIRLATDWLTQSLKKAFIGQMVETIHGKNLVRCKVVDVEDGKLVLENGTRREWRNVEPVVICDGQDEAQRHEVGEASKEKDHEGIPA